MTQNRNYSKMARKLNKASRYMRKEIISKLKIDPTTFDNWRKKGLHPIDTDTIPHMYIGKEVIQFLNGLVKKRKHICQPGEIFCVICQMPVFVELETVSITKGRINLSSEKDSRTIHGTGSCGHKVQRFSNQNDVEKYINYYRDSADTEKIITNLQNCHYIGQISEIISNGEKDE